MPRDLGPIFKAYDVRGVVPDQLDDDAARRIGEAFAEWAGAKAIAVGRDCRLSSPALAGALMDGVTSRGVDVWDLGLVSTALLYSASGDLDGPGVSAPASHNPPQYNGLKFCRAGAAPVGEDTGLGEIRSLAERDGGGLTAVKPGRVAERDMLDRFVEHVMTFVDADSMVPLTVATDTANGMGGLVVPAVMDRLPVKLIALYQDLDGTFPNHPADPINPENQVDLKRAVMENPA